MCVMFVLKTPESILESPTGPDCLASKWHIILEEVQKCIKCRVKIPLLEKGTVPRAYRISLCTSNDPVRRIRSQSTNTNAPQIPRDSRIYWIHGVVNKLLSQMQHHTCTFTSTSYLYYSLQSRPQNYRTS
jgi:hypothetical protein